MDFKTISPSAVPRALELAERYRLLNEPEQAASIYRDVLAADPGNAVAARELLLCVTDQFGKRHGTHLADAERLVGQIEGEYARAYYTGVAYERWGRAQMELGAHASLVGDWLRRAMERYETADGLRPEGDESARLRWNACARLMEKAPGLAEEREHVPDIGD